MDHSLSLNRANWDERAHAASPGYDIERFISDRSFISEIVRFDLPRLGDITGLKGVHPGLKGVHLQCHIGPDTVSLARLGARMTGLDFSPAALAEARRLATLVGATIDFVEAEVSEAPNALGRGRYDFVFTGMGALCWLPKIRTWAGVVAELLSPGGWLFIREAHPMLWTLADRTDELLVVDYAYFERDEPT